MNLFENFKMAMESIVSNKMRSFLTMLGIIIGISSVIAIVSLGQGGQNAITGEFEKIGAATVNIRVNASKAVSSDYITLEDVKQIKEKVESIKYVSPIIQKYGMSQTDKKSKMSYLIAGNSDLLYIQNVELLFGRYLNEKEVLEGKPVVVIDEYTARYLYGYTDVVGKEIKIGSRTNMKKASIVGVSKSMSGVFGNMDIENMPGIYYTSLNFLRQIYDRDSGLDNVSIMSTSRISSESSGWAAVNILESRHNNRGKEIYKAENALAQLEQINKVVGIFTAFIGAVAAISLIVGGIGVMNIMLVSVTERTREIGIRKSIGATTNHILVQFLTESVIISLIGGTLGMILGIIAAFAIGQFAGITPSLSLTAIAVAILFSSAVGIFFGIYPAKKAAKLNPIDALRYE